ncbi:AlpA family phage regulatory protein [Phytopseudomonas dryadis]|nr:MULTISPECIES: AlpA family phage regulatory protein [Pseudomonas]
MKKGTTETVQSHAEAAQLDPGTVIIRMPELEKITGLKRATIYKYMKADPTFPRQVPLSDSKQRGAPVGWVLAEAQAWVRSRSALRGEAA